MEITIEQRPTADTGTIDPIFRYLGEYLTVISKEITGDLIHNMPELYTYLLHLKEEFTSCNPNYRLPSGFHIEYQREDDSEMICICSILADTITITPINHEKSTDKNRITDCVAVISRM